MKLKRSLINSKTQTAKIRAVSFSDNSLHLFISEAIHSSVSTTDVEIEKKIYLFLKDAKHRIGQAKENKCSKSNKKPRLLLLSTDEDSS
jgi:hypothetical protein